MSSATVGETLTLHGRDRDAEIEVRVREPRTPNAKGQRPHVNRIDIITGRVTGPPRIVPPTPPRPLPSPAGTARASGPVFISR